MKKMIRLFCALALLSIAICGCVKLAIWTAPKKHMSLERTKQAIEADEFFWQSFHAGSFDKIDNILTALTAAYINDPNDWLTAAHIGFVYAWRLTERSRFSKLMPNIVNDAVLALWYFEEAHKLNPKDARISGFLADMKMTVATISKDEPLLRKGYFQGLASIKAWPEFNLFTIGYVLSTKPPHDQHFKDALAWQWQTLDLCTNSTINRSNPDYSVFMTMEEKSKLNRQKSACWNSDIAPHNFEGFFLNMGDMLAKTGDLDTAIVIYNNAKLSKSYEQWPYKHILEQKLNSAHLAKKSNNKLYIPEPMMVESTYGCMACHQSK